MIRRLPELSRTFLLACALGLLSGCSHEADGDDVPEQRPVYGVDAQKLHGPAGLGAVAALPHAEVMRRLGAHRLEAHTQWEISPPPKEGADTSHVSLNEDVLVEVARDGSLHLLHENDHGQGTETVLFGGQFFMKMRYGPFIRRRTTSDEVTRLLAAATDESGALLSLLSPFIQVGTVEKVQVAGRTAYKLPLQRRASPLRTVRQKAPLPPEQKWREATQVSALDGTAVVDGEKGVLLGLRLSASFDAPRATALVHVDVTHRMTVGSLGEDVQVKAPSESMEQPVRPRPMLDRQELLDGLVPETRRP